LEARGNWKRIPEEEALENANFYWRQVNLLADGYNKIDKRLCINPSLLIFNHFEVIHGICTKTSLIKSLKKYYEGLEAAKQCGYTHFDTTPTTFVISKQTDEREAHLFMQRFRELASGGSKHERVPFKHCAENMWVVKPAALN
jgi:hypothetical protein